LRWASARIGRGGAALAPSRACALAPSRAGVLAPSRAGVLAFARAGVPLALISRHLPL
jgi:hypothetical protein